MYRNTYVEIETDIIENNAKVMTSAFPHKYNIAVVKGNAYGHGYGIIPALLNGGINAFAVSTVEEALSVREYDSAHPVILLQPVSKENYDICEKNNISVCVNCRETLEEIIESNKKLSLQFKVNCGMNRLGYSDKEKITDDINRALGLPRLFVEGVFSHFHTSGYQDREYELNRKTFENITEGIDLSRIPMVHIDKTQTVLLHDTPMYCNGARFGLSLYGFTSIYPYSNSFKGRILSKKRELKNRLNHVEQTKPLKNYDVKPALKLISGIIQVNDVRPDAYVGYGLVHKAKGNEKVAVAEIGYSDGLRRDRKDTEVAINGKRFRLIGEIGMGMCQILVDDSVVRGDKAVILGGEISIRNMARHLNTTTYEVLTGINPTIPRKYL